MPRGENFRLDASRAFLCLYKSVRKGDGVEKQSEVKIYAKQESKTLNLWEKNQQTPK